MKSVTAVCGTLALAAAAVLTAPSAAAIVPPADGHYTYTEAGLAPAEWIMQAICTQPNGTRAQSDYHDQTIQTLGCDLILTSKIRPAPSREEMALTMGGRAKLADGLWTFSVPNNSGVLCPDGSTEQSTEIFSFSEVTLTGMHRTMNNAVCGLEPGMREVPFTLSFVGPLDPATEPSVIERFPMNCDYLAGRPSICS